MSRTQVIALTGGVGGAKLCLGLARCVEGDRLACIVNTADDFVHVGLRISPDLDTLLYTLAGCANPELGWGRQDETWTFMAVLEQLGGPTWFRLGDGDLAVHIERTRRLASGESLTGVTARLASRFGVESRLLPMTDDTVATRVHTDQGPLDFQDYFVRHRAAPVVRQLEYPGAQAAHPTPAIEAALASQHLRAIVICPSNPFLSIDPILAVCGMRELLRSRGVPVVAVSPLIAGRAVKGPTAKLMRELGIETTPLAIATHYAGLIDGLVVDESDRRFAGRCGLPTLVTSTLMSTLEDKLRLATQTLEFANEIGDRGPAR
jgi:LPPG:FO 2-phospho-L-lactate transferase